MRGFCIMYYIILWLLVPFDEHFGFIPNDNLVMINHGRTEEAITPMKALDLVKERYAANFDKMIEDSKEKYYYKLATADLYLCYEEEVGEDKDYIIHLYEFVEDIPETGMGHTVTYGWYTVDRESGKITAKEY